MWLRRAFYWWLFPATIVLPLWLLIGWGVFQAGGWVFLWVLFVAIPSVLIGQLLLALLVRARPSVRANAAVSWLDVAGFTVWHVLIIFVGCFIEAWFPLFLTGAIAAAIGLFGLTLRQLRAEMVARSEMGSGDIVYGEATSNGSGFARPGEVLIVTDVPPRKEDPRSPSE